MKNCGTLAKTEVTDLELPDWSGMDRFTPRISAEDAFRLNQEYGEKYLSHPRFLEEWQKREKCEVEFIL